MRARGAGADQSQTSGEARRRCESHVEEGEEELEGGGGVRRRRRKDFIQNHEPTEEEEGSLFGIMNARGEVKESRSFNL